MDLSSIPLALLKAEHEAVDIMQKSDDWVRAGGPICKSIETKACFGDECAISNACDDLLYDTPGWAERKERYLLALRAEIERRVSCE